MNHVYLVLVHNNPGQLYRLIERLSYADTKFVIHVDAMADLCDFTDVFENGRQDIIFLLMPIKIIKLKGIINDSGFQTL